MKKASTRQGREQWQAELDNRGLIRSDWAEKYATGAICLNFPKYVPLLEDFNRKDLLNDQLRLIWDAVYSLDEDGTPVDMPTIHQRLSDTGNLEELPGGTAYLIELMDQTEEFHDANHMAEWLKIISRAATLRRFTADAAQLITTATVAQDLEALRSGLSRLLEAVPEVADRRQMSLSEAIDLELDQIEAGVSDSLKVTIPEIDEMTGGFAGSELVVYAARPGQGKTMVVSQMVDHAAQHGHPVMIVSEEMSIRSLAKRTIPRIVSVEKDQWREEMRRLRFEKREHYANCAPIIVREFSVTVERIERAIATCVRTHGIKFCVIDYAQLIRGKGSNRYEQISDVSTRMKQVANRHGITVFLLAQLGRDIDKRDGFKPIMSDLKDTGQLEQDADVILAGVWPAKFDEQYPDPHEYRIHQLKNRNRGIFHTMTKMHVDPIRQRLRSTADVVSEQF